MPAVLNQAEIMLLPDWFPAQVGRILLIVVLSLVLYALLNRVVPRTIRMVVARREDRDILELNKRIDTLTHVAVGTGAVVIILVASFMALAELGLNIAPALTGLGIVGVAIGLGAQSLVKDTISGLFILVEDQYGKGDIVTVAGITGLVEDVNLRRTVLRDMDGTVHSIPNGQITVASNLTREWSRVNLNVSVVYGQDLERVISVVNRVGQELAQDPYFGPLITDPPQFLRVDNLAESGMVLKISGVTKPMKQWEVTGELRKRVLEAFFREDILVPTPFRPPRAEVPQEQR